MAKFIFVTGGVVSGLGKGITAASLGRLLKNRGLKVAVVKCDPYLNVDPGTMNPVQHGEVFVTDDGLETDLDLGHYERFIDESLNKYSNITSGRIYQKVLQKEREGYYLGKTVQIIPHVTDRIKSYLYKEAEMTGCDVLITEIGGTVGDIESQSFIEAIRQINIENKNNCCFIHVTLVPYLEFAKEHKTKPTQHSVRTLESLGIHPDIIVARADRHLNQGILDKIALFCNVAKDAVIENLTLSSLYECPVFLHEKGLDNVVCRVLGLDLPEPDMTVWENVIKNERTRSGEVTIALVGKYVALEDAYLSVVESFNHASFAEHVNVKIKWLDSELIDDDNVAEKLEDVDGVIVPGGFGNRGIEGMIATARYCRETGLPYFGICLGMQIAVIEYARHVLGYEDAHSAEFAPNSTHKVIDLMEAQKSVETKGGTMRLGAYPCRIIKGSIMERAYGEEVISERHRHRYEYNSEFRKELEEKGLMVTGHLDNGTIVETVEIPNHPHFIGVQFHPEFKSRPNHPHPLFVELVKAAKARKGIK